MFKLLVNHHKKNSFVNQFRQKRFELLKNGIEKLIQKDHFKILDIGGDIQYWKNIGWQHPACNIHLLNLYESKVPENETDQFSSSVGNGLSLEFKKGEIVMIQASVIIALLMGIAGVGFVIWQIQRVLSYAQGNEVMQSIAAAIQEGAAAFLNREYQVIAVFVANCKARHTYHNSETHILFHWHKQHPIDLSFGNYRKYHLSTNHGNPCQ